MVKTYYSGFPSLPTMNSRRPLPRAAISPRRRRCLRLVALALCGLGSAPIASAHSPGSDPAAAAPRSPSAWLGESAPGTVVVALFSLPGCPYCEAVRTNYLRHLADGGEARALRVVEYDLTDRRVFADAKDRPGAPASPAVLAESMGIRVAPTVAFIGPDGKELAERLVGYTSPDFYGAYLDRRIETARARAQKNGA